MALDNGDKVNYIQANGFITVPNTKRCQDCGDMHTCVPTQNPPFVPTVNPPFAPYIQPPNTTVPWIPPCTTVIYCGLGNNCQHDTSDCFCQR